jgi:hypothetical protein
MGRAVRRDLTPYPQPPTINWPYDDRGRSAISRASIERESRRALELRDFVLFGVLPTTYACGAADGDRVAAEAGRHG